MDVLNWEVVRKIYIFKTILNRQSGVTTGWILLSWKNLHLVTFSWFSYFDPVYYTIISIIFCCPCQWIASLIDAVFRRAGVWNCHWNCLSVCAIQKLTKGKDSWSLAEVVHAIVLLAHFHCLSSFVFGCGVNEELDQDGGHHNGSSDSAPPLGSSPRSVPSPTPLSTAPSSRDGKCSCNSDLLFGFGLSV
jgi:hypothetical protein